MSDNITLSQRLEQMENKRGLTVLIEADEGYYYIKRDRETGTDSPTRTFLAIMTAIANIVASLYLARACLMRMGFMNAADILAVVALIITFEWLAIAFVILKMEYDDINREKELNNPKNKHRGKKVRKSHVTLEEIN